MTSEFNRARRRQERITAEYSLIKSPPSTSSDPLPRMSVLAYGADQVIEREITDLSALIEFVAKWPVTWVNIDPLTHSQASALFLERLGKMFGLHELELEDLINYHQRAKVEEYSGHLFVVTRMLVEKNNPESEQLSLFLGKNFVITFREVTTDCLDSVRDKIRRGRGRIRTEGADYLMYAIIDAVVDSYFPLIAQLADRLEAVEVQVLEHVDKDTPERVYQLKRDIISIRKAAWPTREALSTLYRDTHPLVSETTRVYLRDCYDHSVRIIDFVEMYREVASALMEVHYTRASTRLNEVMKVLTIFTTLFIPPSFIATLYGMNFSTDKSPFNMPELNWYFGYPLALLFMFLFSGGVLLYLKWKGWLFD